MSTADNTREFTPRSIMAAVAAGAGAYVTIAPVIASTQGIFLLAFTEAFGWTRTAVSAAILMCALTGALITPFAGRAIDKFGVRKVMFPAVGLFGLAVMSVSLVRGELWQLYLAHIVIGMTAGFQNMVAYWKVASLWFHRRRGLVLSLITVCYGLGYSTLPKIIQPIIDRDGWQVGYLTLGGLVLASLLVLVPFLRTPPGTQLKLGHDAPATGVVVQGLTPAEARRQPVFWLLMAMLMCGVVSLIGTLATTFPFLTDRGYSRPFAASVLAVWGAGSVLGQLSYGVLADRFNTPRVALPYFVSAICGALLLHYGPSTQLLVAGAFMLGFCQGSEVGLAAYFAGRYFGMRHLGEIYGYIYAGATVASGVGPVVMNRVFDITGSYRPVGLIVVGTLACGLACVLLLKPYVFAARRSGM